MVAPAVVDERLAITALFWAGVVVRAGAAVVGVGEPMLLALAPPQAVRKALENRIPVSTDDRAFMLGLHGQ
jgi:hypothetical protein